MHSNNHFNINSNNTPIPYSRVTRVEIVGKDGREIVMTDVTNVKISMQDDGRTMKVFLND